MVTMHHAGIQSLLHAAVLVHLGRCGLHGATNPQLHEAMGVTYRTVANATEKLQELGLITSYCRSGRKGMPHLLVVSCKGWELLTRPATYDHFPSALTKPTV